MARKTRNPYTYGAAAPELDPREEYRAYKKQRAKQVQRELEKKRQEEEAKNRRERAVRRNQMRALSLSRGYVTFLTIAGIITAGMSVTYVKLQSDMTAHMKSIAKLESQLADVTTDNAAAEKRLSTAGDLRYIKEVAINQFGMGYASEGQVVYYSVDNSDYMNQYADIPD